MGEYRERLPNGFNCPCPPGECVGICAGIGHLNNDGRAGCAGGEHPFHFNNQFGLDLETYGNFNWTESVCKKDSDGDGLSNGDELGDPCCIWSQGKTPTRSVRGQLSHPGTATSKANFKSCTFDAPTIRITNANSTQSAITLQINSNNSCLCSMIFEIATENNSYSEFSQIKISNGNVFSLTALNESSLYFIRITFANLNGTVVTETNVSTLPISPSAPQPPSSITLLFSASSSLAITWNQVNGASGYELDMAEPQGAFSTVYRGPDTSFQATGLTNMRTYKFRVRSFNSYGLGTLSETFQFTTGAGPSTTGLVLGGATTGTLDPNPNPGEDGSEGYTGRFITSQAPRAGQVTPITIQLFNPVGFPVLWSDLMVYHDRRLKVVFIGGEGPFDIFGAIHPEDFNGASIPVTNFELEFVFPKSGSYIASLHFVVQVDSVAKFITIVIPFVVESDPCCPDLSLGSGDWTSKMRSADRGYNWQGPQSFTSSISVNSSTLIGNQPGLNTSLTITGTGGSIFTSECSKFLFKVEDSTNGNEVSILRSFLSSGMQVILVHENQTYVRIVHAYPTASPNEIATCEDSNEVIAETFGPLLMTGFTFRLPGWYQVFAPFNFNGTQIFVPSFRFLVEKNPNEVPPLTPDDVQDGDYPYSVSLLDGQLIVYWAIEPGSRINVALVAKTSGWIGIGFNPEDDGMLNCDMIMGFVNDADGHVTVYDMYSTGEVTPTEDIEFSGHHHHSGRQHGPGTNDILESNGNQNSFAGTTTIKFRRYLETSDGYDTPISDETIRVVFALNPNSDLMIKHGVEFSGLVKINFIQGTIEGIESLSTQDMRISHAAMMVFAWLVFAPIGIFIARFGHDHKWWFPVHIVVMVTACVLSIIGFIISILMTSKDFLQDDVLILIHSWIGLSVFIGGCAIQPIVGIIADRMWNPERKQVPVWPDKIHWLIGRYSFIAGVGNCLLGMIYMKVHYLWFVLYFVGLAFWIGIYHYLDLLFNKKEKKGSIENKEEMIEHKLSEKK